MGIQFHERSYSGKIFRPRPEIFLDAEEGLLIVATPWGARASARKVIDRMTEYLRLAKGDNEVTSPFERLSCLSTQANNLRIASFLANEALYREDNRREYSTGVELFAGSLQEDEFVWVQAGNPQILMGRTGRGLLPLGSQIDLAFDMSEGSEILPPLPSHLLGLDVSLNPTINSFRARPGDRVILLSHSHLPEILFSEKWTGATVESLSLALAKAHADVAFWLGIIDIGKSMMEID